MITSASNSQMKNIVQLNKKSRERSRQDVFVAEGVKMFREVPKDRLLQVYVSETFYKEEKHQKLLEGCPWELVSDSVFQAVSDTKTPQGVI